MTARGDELRRQDVTLDDDQQAVQEAFGDFFAKKVPPSVVRAAEPLGFDPELWRALLEMGVATMGLPESAGGDGATAVDLVLVAEELGKVAAPVPLISHLAATRLLARAGVPAEVLAPFAAGERVATLALHPVRAGARQLVPDAALARDVVAQTEDGLRLFTSAEPPAHVANQGCAPLAWWSPDGASDVVEIGSADGLFADAVAEWKLLTAAALVGLADSALGLGVEFAKTRRTLGVPIGSLQAISHPLADVVMGIAGARNLVRKAAWHAEHTPGARPDLSPAAFEYARRTTTEAVTVSVHVQGGLGFTVEADISLFFLRAKTWAAPAGDSADDRRRIAAAFLKTAFQKTA